MVAKYNKLFRLWNNLKPALIWSISGVFEGYFYGSVGLQTMQRYSTFKPLSASLQAANCFRNSRFVVDEYDLMWVANEKQYCYYKAVRRTFWF